MNMMMMMLVFGTFTISFLVADFTAKPISTFIAPRLSLKGQQELWFHRGTKVFLFLLVFFLLAMRALIKIGS